VEDYNYVGWTQDVDGDGEIDFIADPVAYRTLGLSTMPSLAADNAGSIFFIYASTTETYDNLTNNYKHIWARAFCTSADSWGAFTDLTGDIIHIFDEFYFPQLAPQTDEEQGLIHMVYNIDATPGIAWSEQHDWQENRLVYVSASKYDFCPVGITEKEEPGGFAVSHIFPNPSMGACYIKADLPVESKMTREIFDLTGRIHLREELGWMKPGTHYLKIETVDLPPGIYFLRLAAGDHSVTQKMTVR
jgi:hypothetical protein